MFYLWYFISFGPRALACKVDLFSIISISLYFLLITMYIEVLGIILDTQCVSISIYVHVHVHVHTAGSKTHVVT